MAKTYRRIGADSKCPACGWRIDADAYRCPKCFIYFCYKCRKRVQNDDHQCQCVNQKCACHGKLLCVACTVMMPVFKKVIRTKVVIPEKITPAETGLGTILFWITAFCCISAWVLWSVLIGLVAGVTIFAVSAMLFHNAGQSFWGTDETTTPAVTREVTEQKQIREDRCCIQCRKPAEALR